MASWFRTSGLQTYYGAVWCRGVWSCESRLYHSDWECAVRVRAVGGGSPDVANSSVGCRGSPSSDWYCGTQTVETQLGTNMQDMGMASVTAKDAEALPIRQAVAKVRLVVGAGV